LLSVIVLAVMHVLSLRKGSDLAQGPFPKIENGRAEGPPAGEGGGIDSAAEPNEANLPGLDLGTNEISPPESPTAPNEVSRPAVASSTEPDCLKIGAVGSCLNREIFSQLERADYAFNAPTNMLVSKSQAIALVINSTGSTNFDEELDALAGNPTKGNTPISLIMEAEIVGPAFEIEPSGRQRRVLSSLNPTRWDWDVSPLRGGLHQLEVSLYVIATRDGESVGEEKAIADRRVITVTVSPLQRLSGFVSKIDPIFTFLIAIGGAITAILAWFGVKSWRGVRGLDDGEDELKKIEVIIKESPAAPKPMAQTKKTMEKSDSHS